MSEQIHIAFVKTLWGVTEQMGNGPSGYDSLFARIKKDGFDAVETPISLVADKEKFAEAKPSLFSRSILSRRSPRLKITSFPSNG